VILLPSEPFAYQSTHLDEVVHLFSDTIAARLGQIWLIDGSLLTWHGTRLARALQELPNIFAGIQS
jgi:hypothetical protein